MKKITLKIDGMHCVSCAMSIDGDLEDYVKGVKRASTSYAKQVCEVEVEDTVKAESLINQIHKTGYKAQVG